MLQRLCKDCGLNSEVLSVINSIIGKQKEEETKKDEAADDDAPETREYVSEGLAVFSKWLNRFYPGEYGHFLGALSQVITVIKSIEEVKAHCKGIK